MIRITIDIITVLLFFAVVGELSGNKTVNYWIAAVSFYILSLIAEKGLAVFAAFVMVTLAIGSTFNMINTKVKMTLFLGLGIV